MEDWQQRLLAEHNELVERLTKLEAFIRSSKFLELSSGIQDAMGRQLVAMRMHAKALSDRINLLGVGK